MNLVEFQRLSKRTMPFGGEPANPIEFENMLGNYAMGLIGEITEVHALVKNRNPFDAVELKKELGDVCHYAVGIAAITGIELPEHLDLSPVSGFTVEKKLNHLVSNGGLIVELAKKRIYHRHDIELQRFNPSYILRLIEALAIANEIKLSDVLQTNIDKLKTRYPDKFNVEDSIARKDVQA